MMPAAKHGDPQIGVDVHLCVVPPSPSPVPLPTPHTSIVFDPFDYLPILGATVTVCGMKRATAGTNGKAIHIPPGFPFAPKMPDTSDEIFMGSATVVADGDPFSFLSVPVLSCQVAGIMSPPRLKKKEKKLMLLPTVTNLAIPTNVFIGGPPTISLMGMASKLGFAALGKFAKSNLFKRVRKKLFGKLKPGFLKCKILRAEPVDIITGEVSVEQQDFHLPGRIPIDWVRAYTSNNTRKGACGYGWETPADIRLEVFPQDNSVAFLRPAAAPALFPEMPAAGGEDGAVLELWDGALLGDHGSELQVRTKEDLIYHFEKVAAFTHKDGVREYPINRISDLCGNWLAFERHGPDVTTIKESAGRRIEIETEDGLIQQLRLFAPSAEFRHVFVQYRYDDVGNLLAVLDALGNPYTFAYDDHRLVRHTDRNGLSFYYEFERTSEEWRVVHAWGDGGLFDYRFEYVDLLRERRITDSLGGVTLVTLDERALPISEMDPLGGITVYEYDDVGRTSAVIDAANRRTEYHHDEAGNLLRMVRPDGLVVATGFSAHNKPLSITDASGSMWQLHWDERGLLTGQTSPLGHESHYEYDHWGQLVAHTNTREARMELRIDALGNLAEVLDALGHRLRVSHDALGRVQTKQDALGRRTEYRYDAKGRLASATMPSGSTIACAYDAADNLTAYTDESGATTYLEYFGQGQVARRIQPDGHAVECLYDTEENLVGVRNQRDEVYHLRRDLLGRLVEEIDYWGQSRRYAYDPAGSLTHSIDPLGQRIDYVSDAFGRITQKRVSNPPDNKDLFETFAYNAQGDVVEATNAHVRITREFDAEGRLVKDMQTHTDGRQFIVESDYDAQGNRIRRTTTDHSGASHVTECDFDLLNQVTRIVIDGGSPLRLDRNALGQVTHEELGPDLNRRLTYSADGDLIQHQLVLGSEQLFATRYEYDAVGNLVARDDSQFGCDSYTYDPVGRILAHTDPQRIIRQFVSDPAGDRLVTHVVGGGAVSALNGRSDDWRREGEYQGTRWRFDRAGNLTVRDDGDQRLDLIWDANQRLSASRRFDSGGKCTAVTMYAYDPLGRRLFKETAGTRTWFGWDGDAMCAEMTDTVSREFVYRPETFEPLAMLAGGTLLYVNDPNGCPTRLIDDRGRVRWSATYSIAGHAEAHRADDVHNPLRLQGQYEDAETGLAFNRHRYFDARLGQFVSQDPMRLMAGSHLYAYAPNPFGWIDPLGLNPVCRLKGRTVTNASDLPLVRPGTREWNEAVEAIRCRGRGDIRVETIQEAKQLLREARGNMDRRKNYTKVKYSKGYEVHNTHNATSRAREMAVGNDLRHIKWQEGASKADWSEGHIFFGNVF